MNEAKPYAASLKSGRRRRSACFTMLPQIFAPLRSADSASAVSSAEANRAGTEADVAYWRQQTTRLEALLTAGAISKAELDQAQNSLRTAEARLAALDAQVREGRVQLAYYRVVAPQAIDNPAKSGKRPFSRAPEAM